MKKRVISNGTNFYPQRRGFLGWRFFYKPGEVCIDGLQLGDEIVCFKTLQEAVNFFTPEEIKIVWTDAV